MYNLLRKNRKLLIKTYTILEFFLSKLIKNCYFAKDTFVSRIKTSWLESPLNLKIISTK